MTPADAASAELEAVMDRFGRRVRMAGRGRGLPEARLDELLQEVRIRLWKARERGENLAGLPASYVHRTALTAATDLLRRSRARREDRKTSIETADAPAPLRAPRTEGPEGALERKELAASIEAALATLSDTRRPVVRMYLAGYHREEIAELLRWSEAKTRNLLYRGLADLREELTRRGRDPRTT